MVFLPATKCTGQLVYIYDFSLVKDGNDITVEQRKPFLRELIVLWILKINVIIKLNASA